MGTLPQARADVGHKDKYGRTAGYGHTTVAEVLINIGALLDMQITDSDTKMMIGWL